MNGPDQGPLEQGATPAGPAGSLSERSRITGPLGVGLVAVLLAGLGLMIARRRTTRLAAPPGVDAAEPAGATEAADPPGVADRTKAAAAVTDVPADGAASAARAVAATDADPRTGSSAGTGTVTDASSLLAEAEELYVLLQALDDQGDLAGLRARTTDDVYTALAARIRTRTDPSSVTVLSVGAELVDAVHGPDRLAAKVRYRSTLSPGVGRPPQSFDEIWEFVRDDLPSSHWRLAGIEEA